MRDPGSTDSENDPVYRAGMLLAQAWEVIDSVLAGKVARKEIVPTLGKAQATIRLVIELLKEAD